MNAVVQQQTFEQKLMGKIKDSIGDMMTEDDLKKIVERGIEEALFKPRFEDSYGRVAHKPSLVQEALEKFLTTHVRSAVDEWLAANQDKIAPIVEKIVKEGAGAAVLAAVTMKFESEFHLFGNNVLQSLRG